MRALKRALVWGAVGLVVLGGLVSLTVWAVNERARAEKAEGRNTELTARITSLSSEVADLDEEKDNLEGQLEDLQDESDFYAAVAKDSRDISGALDECVDRVRALVPVLVSPQEYDYDTSLAAARAAGDVCNAAQSANARLNVLLESF